MSYQRLNQPYFAPVGGFLRAPLADFSDLGQGAVAILGAPHDSTCSSRQGARFGPLGIRQASQYLGDQFARADGELMDLATGQIFHRPGSGMLLDLGDLNVHPNDIERTTGSIRDGVAEAVSRGAFPVTLGGDHYISYPAFMGFADGFCGAERKKRVGFIQLDSHFDLGDVNLVWGRYWHGSNARRISQVDVVDTRNMCWIGVNGTTRAEQFEFAKSQGLNFFHNEDIKQLGIVEVTRRAIQVASAGTDAIYVSLDIDIVDSLWAPGTGAIVWDGITPHDLLTAMQLLGEANVQALDLVEVAPNLEPTESTSRLAALAILRMAAPRLFQARA
jgi:arginase family enzyme